MSQSANRCVLSTLPSATVNMHQLSAQFCAQEHMSILRNITTSMPVVAQLTIGGFLATLIIVSVPADPTRLSYCYAETTSAPMVCSITTSKGVLFHSSNIVV